MSSCDCSRPVVILQGASGLSTLYSSNGTLLGDRVVTANNNDLTFNMGSGVFIVNGLVTVSGLDLLTLSSNPGDSNTLWASGNNLYIGSQNLSLRISTDAGNILSFGADSGIFLDAGDICSAINNCDLSDLGDVSNSVASSGQLLYYNGTQWVPRSVSIDALSDVYLISAPTTGQSLIWSAVYSAFIPGNVTQNLTISGGGATQTITPSDTLKFAASGDLSLSVASDTVTYGFTESITSLTYNSDTTRLTFIDESGGISLLDLSGLVFTCGSLNGCSISSLNDVSTSGATNGQILTYNGSTWVADDYEAFSCSSLNTCSISDLADVELVAPTDGQILTYSTEYSAFVNTTAPFSHFSITDGVTSQTIASTNSITFVGVSGATVAVTPTDTVRIALNETTTSLTFNSGTNTLTFTDEDGAANNVNLTSAASFSCSSLNACTVDAMSDVHYVSAPTSNQVLAWSAVYSAWIPSTPFTSFTISGGGGSQTISNGNTLTFSGANNVDVVVSATDTVTISYTENLTSLTFDSGNRSLTYTDESGATTNLTIFDCTYLSGCSIDSFSDVNTSGATNGKVLAYNGSVWVPTTVSVSGSGFSCTSLSGCSADSLADITYPAPPSNGETLTWSAAYSGWIPSTPFSSFTISGGGSTQTISNGNTLSFSGVSGVVVNVAATDRVNIGFAETVTTLVYDSGLNRLTYTDESGGSSVINLVSGSGSGAFSCASLNVCSIDSLSDVALAAPTAGQMLLWSTEYSAFVNGDNPSSFTISGGGATQTIANGNTLSFSGAGSVSVLVSATDRVTISYAEALTTLGAVSGQYLRYTDESGALTNIDVCALLGNCSLDRLSDVSTSGASNGYILTYSGSSWTPQAAPGGGGFVCSDLNACSITSLSDVSGTPSNNQALVWDSGTSKYRPSNIVNSFNITDGFNPQVITNGNSIIFAAGGDLSVATSATDTVTYSFDETVTTMTYNSGTRILGYTSEDGTVTSVTIPSGFTCSLLNTCSVDSLSDVNTAGAVSGQYLKWNGSNWVPASGITGVSVDAGNDLTVGTDSLPFFNETVTALSVSGTNYLKYVPESGAATTINICSMLSGCSIDALSDVTISAASSNQILRWNGSAWINSDENVAGSYSFIISDGSTTQTINTGNTLTFADSNCISATVSATDTVSFAPILSPAQTFLDASGTPYEFPNSIICNSSGLYAPCFWIVEPTIETGAETLKIRAACGSTWDEYDIPWIDNIKRVPVDALSIADGDASALGVDLVVDGNDGRLYYNDDAAGEYKQLPGTFGYIASTSFTAGVEKEIIHNLHTQYVIVQVWQEDVSYNELQTCTIRVMDDDKVRITTPLTDTHKVCILPVFPLV